MTGATLVTDGHLEIEYSDVHCLSMTCSSPGHTWISVDLQTPYPVAMVILNGLETVVCPDAGGNIYIYILI